MTEKSHIMTVGREAKEFFGDEALKSSCLGQNGEERLIWAVKNLAFSHPDIGSRRLRVAEIGTNLGVSSTILAKAGFDVVTFDVMFRPFREKVWDHFGVRPNITDYTVEDDAHTHAILQDEPFDIAFIDGCHELKSVQANFLTVKKCGRVIFHDYEHQLHANRTVKFVDELKSGQITKFAPFATWLRCDLIPGGCDFKHGESYER